MPRRHPPEALSPRALARLRASPGSYVPTELDLEAVAPARSGRGAAEAGDRTAATNRLDQLDSLDPVEAADVRGGGRHARARHPRVWVRLPAAFVGARWQPGRAALLGIVLVVLLAAAVFGLRVAWAQSAGGGTVIAPGGGSGPARAGWRWVPSGWGLVPRRRIAGGDADGVAGGAGQAPSALGAIGSTGWGWSWRTWSVG